MNGMHDLGGKQGFGPVRHSADAAVFHASWEVRANALYSLAVKHSIFNMDEYRYAIERMEPRHYLQASYYERSLTSLATLCVEKGLISKDELERRTQGSFPLAQAACAGRTNRADRQTYLPGDLVRVRDDHVSGHVRMPGYIRGKRGGGCAGNLAEHRSAGESRASGIVEVKNPAYHFSGRKQAGNGHVADVHHLGLGRSLDATECEGDTAGDSIRLERRLIQSLRPIGFGYG